jgi:hypothetical protein
LSQLGLQPAQPLVDLFAGIPSPFHFEADLVLVIVRGRDGSPPE